VKSSDLSLSDATQNTKQIHDQENSNGHLYRYGQPSHLRGSCLCFHLKC